MYLGGGGGVRTACVVLGQSVVCCSLLNVNFTFHLHGVSDVACLHAWTRVSSSDRHVCLLSDQSVLPSYSVVTTECELSQ
jgi:hypothetical protein